MKLMKSPKSGRSNGPRICLFSQRNIYREVFRSGLYEFEDVISEIDDVELLTPEPYRFFVIGQKIANRLARHISYASLNPGLRKLRINKSYDLFLATCMFPKDLLSLNAIEGWKERCRTSVCYLVEIWAGELHKFKGHLKILSQFDYVVLNCNASVQLVQDAIGRPCFYMPPGIDTIRFCPYSNPPLRSIDVYSLGRKSPVTHKALLKMVDQKQIFYIYDTVDKKETSYPRQHRNLVANIAKRSRYFLVNPGKIDLHVETHGQSEIGFRFFEGAASGTVMIGEAPENEAFGKHFDWPDSVIRVPFDEPNIAEILDDLDLQADRLEEIRRNNVIQSLLRHGWVYRWKAILDIVGIEPRPPLIAREKRLKKLAKDVERA